MKRERLPNPPECKKVKHQLVFLLRLSRIRTCHLFLVRIKNENMKHQAFSTVPRTGSQPMKGIHKSQSSRGNQDTHTHTHTHTQTQTHTSTYIYEARFDCTILVVKGLTLRDHCASASTYIWVLLVPTGKHQFIEIRFISGCVRDLKKVSAVVTQIDEHFNCKHSADNV